MFGNTCRLVVASDDDGFSADAAALLESWVHNQMLQTQILTHDDQSGVPYVLLFKRLPGSNDVSRAHCMCSRTETRLSRKILSLRPGEK